MLTQAKRGSLNLNVLRILSTSVSLVLAYAILCLSIFLQARRSVSPTIAFWICLSIALGVLTVFVLGARCFLLFHRRRAMQHGPTTVVIRPVIWLEAACRRGIKCLMFFWSGLAIAHLMIATREPTCLNGPLSEWKNELDGNSWHFGLSCKVYRAIAALSTSLAVSLFLVFFATYCRPSPCCSSSGSSNGSIFSYDKDDRLYLATDRRVSRTDREQWLQRRNSVSSQRAMYPRRHGNFDPRGARYATYSFAPSGRYPSTLGSVSEGACLDLSDRSSSFNSSQSGSGSSSRSRRSTPLARGRANSSPEKLMTVRHEKASQRDAVPAVPPLPAAPAPAWCPTLNHAPLSADPSILALTSGAGGGQRASLSHSRSLPAVLAQVPLRARSVEPAVVTKREGSSSNNSIPTPSSVSTHCEAPSVNTHFAPACPAASASASPPPAIPPPPPPLTSILPLVPHPLFARPNLPLPPPMPVIPSCAAPGPNAHSVLQRTHTTLTSTPSSSSSIRPAALRRPSPIRNRPNHNQHHYKNYHYTPQQHMQQYQQSQGHAQGAALQQQHGQQQQYHHHHHRGRYRRRDPSSSVYSASSYVTRASSACMPAPAPVMGNAVAVASAAAGRY